MRASFLKSKVRSLRKFDLIKAVIDILLPDLVGLGDYNPEMFYRKGDRVYYYDEVLQRSKIIEAKVDITTGQEINLDNWSVVGGASLSNSEILKKLEVNANNNLMYEGAILNNVHVSRDEPKMNERDIWFGLSTSDGDGGTNPPPTGRENELVIKNMVVQDDRPSDDNYLWGDIEGPYDIIIDDENN